ncbi:MAG: dehydrogenase, partial [Phycisphaeraceae bacterium]|nr:dehydrogenase [Phycisphaeraceae bacterium]
AAVAAGRLGRMVLARADTKWFRSQKYYDEGGWRGTWELDGGGALMNQSIHGVDAIQWIASATMPDLGAACPVSEVFAYTAQRGHDEGAIEVEDIGVAVLRFRNGAMGQVLGATSMYPGSLKRLQIAGRDGTGEVLEDELITWAFREARDEDDGVRKKFGEATRSGGGASDPMAIDYTGHTRNIDAFLRWLDDDEPFMLDGTEARKAVAIIEAMYESARTGRAVSL